MQEDLDNLKIEVNKLKNLLDNPELGIGSWFMFLGERLENIHKISKKIGVI